MFLFCGWKKRVSRKETHIFLLYRSNMMYIDLLKSCRINRCSANDADNLGCKIDFPF